MMKKPAAKKPAMPPKGKKAIVIAIGIGKKPPMGKNDNDGDEKPMKKMAKGKC